MILALDPSSTKTGWAIHRAEGGVVAAGILSGRGNAINRIRSMGDDMLVLVEDYGVAQAIVEIPATKVHAARRGAHGLATYGAAVGYLLALLDDRLGAEEVHTVQPSEWTRNRPKKTRVPLALSLWPAYREQKDRGLDMADAICLGEWWRKRRRGESCR